MVEARPNFPPLLIREALKQTASNAASPDNNYGWGIIDVEAALNWGADFVADTTIGDAPLTVQFTSLSTLNPTEWLWDFGDGETSNVENPEHLYELPGSYSVSLTITSQYGPITSLKNNYVIAMGDTLTFAQDSTFAGKTVDLSVSLRNSQPLNRIIIPFDLPETPFPVTFDSALLGSRTAHFENIRLLAQDVSSQRWAVELVADDGGGAEPLTPGSGEIMILRLGLDRYALGGLTGTVTSSPVAAYTASLESDIMSYEPAVVSGSVGTKFTQRCDVDYSNDGIIDISDITSLIAYMFMLTYTPPSLHLSDCNNSLSTDMSDINFLIAYLFIGGPAPDSP
ncbi:MAG: PKD domain-containing protein [Candidatus Zixiibacteriota bacterium]|nr:MAG: PKD domain-containing protein [candidate division Zixibacteria bacterium]